MTITPPKEASVASPVPGTAQESVDQAAAAHPPEAAPPEFGGRKDGSEPTRYGDWEKHGRCIDF